MKYAAFDYDKQVWIEGEVARLLRLEQLRYELTILHGKNALRYAQFTGKDLSEAIEATNKAIGELV